MVFASLCPPNLVFCRAQRRGIWWLRRREKDEGYTGLDGLVGVARTTSEAVGPKIREAGVSLSAAIPSPG